jgi:hypothetical protein
VAKRSPGAGPAGTLLSRHTDGEPDTAALVEGIVRACLLPVDDAPPPAWARPRIGHKVEAGASCWAMSCGGRIHLDFLDPPD